jgi:hypothetical protein
MAVTFLVSGAFDVPGYLRVTRLPVVAAWAAGDARPTGALEHPGFSVAVDLGGSETAFGLLAARATEFLRGNGAELDRLAEVPGPKRLALSFVVAQRADPAWIVRLPPELVSLAARHGVEFEFLFLAVEGLGGFPVPSMAVAPSAHKR